MHSPGMARCAAPLRSVFAGTSFGPPRRRLISTITGRLVTAEDDMARLLAGQVTRPVLFAQAMAQAAAGADLIMTAGLGPDAGLTARAALFTAGALTDLRPFLPAANAGEEGRAREGKSEAGGRCPRARWPAGRYRGCAPRRKPALPGRPPLGRSAAAERETQPVR